MGKSIFLRKGMIKDKEATFEMFINSALDAPPADGFTFNVLKERKRISDALDKAVHEKSEYLELEDADYNALKVCVNATKWATRDPFLYSFLETFNIMESV